MTIMPMAPVPTLGTDPAAPAAAGDGAGAETFGALIAAQLGRLAEPAAAGPQAVTSDARAEDVDEDEDAVTLPEQADPAAMPCAPSQVVLAAPALAVAAVAAGPVPAPAPSPLVADAQTEDETEVGAVDGRPTEDHGRPTEAPGHTVVPPAPAAALLHVHPSGQAAGTSDAPVPPEPRLPAPVAPDATAVAAAAVPATEAPAAVLPAAPTPPSVVAPVVTPLAATVPVVTPAPSAAPAPANPVVDQVAPVFTRMVSGPEGQHRMMLRLHPADLGEVHLTVTVRGESVDVTVSATPEAREMLADGSGALRSLLDSVGRTADRIVFRDLPGTGTTVQVISTSTGTNPDGQPSAQPQAGFGESGRSGQHGRDDLGRQHATGAPRDTEADRRTSTTTTPNRTHADGLVRGGLDVRM